MYGLETISIIRDQCIVLIHCIFEDLQWKNPIDVAAVVRSPVKIGGLASYSVFPLSSLYGSVSLFRIFLHIGSLSQVSGLRRRSNNRIDAVAVARNLSQSSAAPLPAHTTSTTFTNGVRHTSATVRHGRTLSDISDRSSLSDTDRNYSDAGTDTDHSSDYSVDIDALSASSSAS